MLIHSEFHTLTHAPSLTETLYPTHMLMHTHTHSHTRAQLLAHSLLIH